MASEKSNFPISGPIHLTQVDWGCPNHRRSVAASLVEGVYVLESDRQERRVGDEALAPPWWEFFRFRLLTRLVDDADSSIFGAVYELTEPGPPAGAPSRVLALRGTLTKPDTISRDLELDLHFLRHGLHATSRCAAAVQAARDLAHHGRRSGSTVWLAGHSLGSTLATLAGKAMAKEGIFLESFLFNPPFISAPVDRIKDRKLKHGLRVAGSFVAAGLALAAQARAPAARTGEESAFAALAPWVPRLFVNPADLLCCEYVGYFEHREKMDELGIGHVERIATRHSLGGLLLGAIYGGDYHAAHLLPSAELTVNLGPTTDAHAAHGIHQWWCPGLTLKRSVHLYTA
ncbi:alpha/beta-Hydrolases superfamily protein [Wolffia australiana]